MLASDPPHVCGLMLPSIERMDRSKSFGGSRHPFYREYLVPALMVSILLGLAVTSGCAFLPRRYEQPTVYNAFPELSRVAVIPFFNHSNQPTVNGAEFARAYYLELQSVPGFEVVPVEVVAKAIQDHRLTFSDPAEVVRLAEILDVDAVVVGVVTDYRPYYPPRVGLHVEWYARDSSVCPIPPGFGIAWNTRQARKLPDWIKTEAAVAWARNILRDRGQADPTCPGKEQGNPTSGAEATSQSFSFHDVEWIPNAPGQSPSDGNNAAETPTQEWIPIMTAAGEFGSIEQVPASHVSIAKMGAPQALVSRHGDSGGLKPTDPKVGGVTGRRIEPVLVHTRVFSGNDPEVTKALATYYRFREDARFGGWQGYLERSEDFIRFCCRLHIQQMLVARGAVGKKQVRWDWSFFR